MSAVLRAKVAKSITQVVIQGKSLTDILPAFDQFKDQDKALARELLIGSLRHYFQLKAISELLLDKPLRKKDMDVLSLILLGLYQLLFTRIPTHAVLSETVQAAVEFKKHWAKGLVNALLRRAMRESEQLLTSIQQAPEVAASMPKWLYQQLVQDWPEDISIICEQSRQRAPLTLRVNCRHKSRDTYLEELLAMGISAQTHPLAHQAIQLEKSCKVTTLPGYYDGDFSVQDSAAQLAAQLLDVEPGHRILDACAAPGGKTAHILELTDNQAKVIALDNSAPRLQRLNENLKRLKLTAKTIVADATDSQSWHQGDVFDRILCDAPCSALGIIRRHPDIAILRRESDIPTFVETQQRLMDALWPLLKPSGIMLYATCSILKAENTQQIRRFLERHADAELITIAMDNSLNGQGESLSIGLQIFPGEMDMDGFYYAKLLKIT